MASYAYYQEQDPILSDKGFESLVHEMKNEWDKIKEPCLEHIDFNRIWLEPTTYPNNIKLAMEDLRNSLGEGKMGK